VQRFRDRGEAGRLLGARLASLRGERPVVVGLPRGGVPVAFEVARALGAPLDVIVVRKLGVPSQPELGLGAIGEDGVRVLNDEVVRLAGVSGADIAAVEARERRELERRARLYRGDRSMVPLAGRTVIVVDDGIATGGTARAALEVARAHGAHRVVLAVPVAARESVVELSAVADDVVALETPWPFYAVGQWYVEFSQTSDDEVVRLLDDANRSGRDEEIEIAADGVPLRGHLTVPPHATGMVIFAHGSGSSRHSPRNQLVANRLNEAGLATVLFDLLTPGEAADRANVFAVELLARRLRAVTRAVQHDPDCSALAVGYFGASTGAAAALWAAADEPVLDAVVSRGGRPDLAGPRLGDVTAPTLLIVGSRDPQVLELNRRAAAMLSCPHRVEVVPGATHLFEEPGTLEAAAQLARDWFLEHLERGPASAH
jgi:putative phosphoribosyl transferase